MSQLVLFSTIETAGRVSVFEASQQALENLVKSVSEASLQALADLVSSHTFLNSCLFMYPRQTPSQYAAMVDLLQHAVVVFVIAHEYAHITAGDIIANGGEGPPLDLHARELAADRRAALTVVEVIDAEAEKRGLGDLGLGILRLSSSQDLTSSPARKRRSRARHDHGDHVARRLPDLL